MNALHSITAWLITHLEASGLIMGFSYLQTSRSDIDIFYLDFYMWSNKRVQSCYTLILSKEQLWLLSTNGASCFACDADSECLGFSPSIREEAEQFLELPLSQKCAVKLASLMCSFSHFESSHPFTLPQSA